MYFVKSSAFPAALFFLVFTVISSTCAARVPRIDLRIGDLRNHALESFTKIISGFFAESQVNKVDFWERAAALGDRVERYAEKLLNEKAAEFDVVEKVTSLKLAMHELAVSARNVEDDVKNQLHVNDIDAEDFRGDLETHLQKLFELLKREFPPPDQAPGHEERLKRITSVMERAKETVLDVIVKHGKDEEVWRARLDELQDRIIPVLVLTGDLAEQHPVLLEVLLFAFSIMIPQEGPIVILRPILGLFGFGPYGPVKGSTAAWAQRVFFGAAVKEASWFAHLQRAAMTSTSWWKSIVGGISIGISLGGGIFKSCGSGR